MPELAEVEYYRKLWTPGLGDTVTGVRLHPKAAVFRGVDPAQIKRQLTGATLLSSEAAAKQMLFRLAAADTAPLWLGIHLGMTGELSAQPTGYEPKKADHLVLDQARRTLVFSDFRMFGRVQFATGDKPPAWWTQIAPAILSPAFTVGAVAAFLQRRTRTAIKPVLLMQERFPGIGNWMADEILWSAGIHPRRPAGSLTPAEIKILHRETRRVCREAIKYVGRELHGLPQSWLFHHRWEDGGKCPKTGVPLVREEIGGRTTCWSPGRQKL
ncbi:MAG: DNA-formamidopyrimidine glycosylase [Rariglobus sp.]|jgi:formamidopyrimidine-DNA glycosylase|nr:DNA-formamidopyrimidine glycosylase [Rariglobus sp.]